MKTKTKKINLVELSTKEMETVQGGYTLTLEEQRQKEGLTLNKTPLSEQKQKSY